VIDGAADTVITTVTVGDRPCVLAYSPTNNKVYCANNNSDNVTVIDGAADTVITTITVGDGPGAFACNPVQNRTYVANQYSSNISVIRDSLTGIEELSHNALPLVLDLYPNPTKTMLTLRTSVAMHSIKIYGVLGNLVRTETMKKHENTTTISTQHLSAGVYFLKVNTEDAELIRKVIVTK